MPVRRYSIHALAAAALLATIAAHAQPPGAPPAAVRVAPAERLMLAPTTTVPGTVTSRFDARVAAEVTGRLVWVAEVGTSVAAGGVVARIDDTQLLLQKTEYEAGVELERGRLEFLSREAQRLESLLADNIAARSVYEGTINDRDVSRSNLAIQRARLAQVNDQLERTEIRAPFSGVVAERMSQGGERVSVGEPILRLTSPDQLEIVARAPLAAVPFLAEGALLRVEKGSENSAAAIRSLVPFGDSRSHLFDIRLELPEGSDWKAGEAVRIAVPIDGRREVVAVPRDALILRRDGAAVFRISEGGTAERIPVATGASDGLMIEVLGMVRAGDVIVIRGGERLRHGQPVMILD